MIMLDSNVVSALMRLHLEPVVQAWLGRQDRNRLCTSAPAVFEIRFGIDCQPPGRKRALLETAFRHVLDAMLFNRVLPLESSAAAFAGAARAQHRRNGVTPEIPDSQMAGIAMAHGASIATRNITDFDGLGIDLVNPWQ